MGSGAHCVSCGRYSTPPRSRSLAPVVASLPRLPIPVEHRVVRSLCALSPRAQRLLFGPPPARDGQVLAPDANVVIKMAKLAGGDSPTAGLPPPPAPARAPPPAATSSGPPPPLAAPPHFQPP